MKFKDFGIFLTVLREIDIYGVFHLFLLIFWKAGKRKRFKIYYKLPEKWTKVLHIVK